MRIQWRKLWFAITIEAGPFWIATGGLIGSCVLARLVAFLRGADLRVAIVYAGTLLDCFGLLLVAKGITDTRKRFGQPSLLGRVRRWFGLLASAFRGEKHQKIITATGRFKLKGGDVSVKIGAPENATIEQRVQVLEQNLDFLREEQRKTIDRDAVKFARNRQSRTRRKEPTSCWARSIIATNRRLGSGRPSLGGDRSSVAAFWNSFHKHSR